MIINLFDLTTPKETDPLSEADNEIRSIKTALLETFPYFDNAFTVKFSDFNKFATSVNITADGKVKIDTPKYKPIIDSKRLYVDNNGKIIYSNPLPPLGSIIKTVLTLDQLDTIYGAGIFRLLNGSSTVETNIWAATPTLRYTSVTTISIPHATEKKTYFIRQTDTDANIDKVAPSSLGAPVGGTSFATVSHSHGHPFSHLHTMGDISEVLYNMENTGTGTQIRYNTDAPYTEGPLVAGGTTPMLYTGYDPGHTHIATLTGEMETRPQNITLHFYLRVN